MRRRAFTHDFLWALYLMGLAVLFGLLHHWHLVQLGQQGQLAKYLEDLRRQRRAAQYASVKLISLDQAFAVWQRGQALFVDARKPEEYRELHIKGARNLPVQEFPRFNLLFLACASPGGAIVVYCSEESCDAAFKVANKLLSLGFTQVMVMGEGFRVWDDKGFPVDTER